MVTTYIPNMNFRGVNGYGMMVVQTLSYISLFRESQVDLHLSRHVQYIPIIMKTCKVCLVETETVFVLDNFF